jgi:hypothetical protein
MTDEVRTGRYRRRSLNKTSERKMKEHKVNEWEFINGFVRKKCCNGKYFMSADLFLT